MAQKWTDAALEKLAPGRNNGERVIAAGTRGQGSLVLRVTDTTRAFYYRYFVDGARRFELIGHHSKSGVKTWTPADRGGVLTLRAALDGIHELAALQNRVGDLKAHFAGEQAQQAAAARHAEAEARAGTFADLLAAYVASIKPRPSWREIDGIFKRHVRKPFARLLDVKANEIKPEDIQQILGRMVKADIKRQTNVARAYLRSAFAWGGKQDLDPRRVEQKRFNLQANPVDLVPILRELDEGNRDVYARMGQHTLTQAELHLYRDALAAVDDPIIRGFLTLHLYSGGQRVEQLLREPWTSYEELDGQPIATLHDPKGRGSVAKPHVVPLVPQAVAALALVRPLNRTWPFSRGKVVPDNTMAGKWLQPIAEALVATKKVRPFTLRDVRRTCETALAALGMPKEHRSQFLSHDRGNRIDQTYNKHEYLAEKLRCAQAWAAYVDETPAENVVRMEGRRKQKA